MNKGSCIIVGRCADYLLKDRKDVLKIFIYGDMDTRKKRIVEVYKEASEEAADLIKKTDKRRSAYYNHYLGNVFGNAENYDICLNSSVLGIEECVRIIERLYAEV